MNWVSYSLYGDSPKYLDGMLANLSGVSQFYPGYKVKVIYDLDTVPIQHVRELRLAGATTVAGDRSMYLPMLWRLQTMDDPGVEIVLFRDADSRISAREAAAVYEWVASSAGAHVMRDFPNHTVPVMGGMWGLKKPEFPGLNFRESYDWYVKNVPDRVRGVDQDFIARMIWPKIRDSVLEHDSFPRSPTARPFPTPRPETGEFVGEVFQNGVPTPEHREFCRSHILCQQHS